MLQADAVAASAGTDAAAAAGAVPSTRCNGLNLALPYKVSARSISSCRWGTPVVM
jgi:hypothetical protein